MWANDAFFYHIYPLGLCGAPRHNDFRSPDEPRLAQIGGWIDHLSGLGVNAVYLGPLFESGSHGYDTVDYYRVDRRLGCNETLADLVKALHARGIRVILDGVFHHVGRDFWAFKELQAQGERTPYRYWFAGVDFSRRSPYGDNFAYDSWRGHYELVKLNLAHPDVREHLFGAIRRWVAEFDIDGLRLDVADEIDTAFLRDLAGFCRGLRPDFWLLGEGIHGDYRRLAGPGLLDSVTNYEVYKALYSSHNDRNYFEIAYTLNRQYGEGGLYRGLPMYAFADNHDVNRIASTLQNPAHLYPLHILLMTMPGVPSIYYGSEWGIPGVKGRGEDGPLRPCLRLPDAAAAGPYPDLAAAIARLARIRRETVALRHGSYRQLTVAPQQLVFAREAGSQRVIVAVNAAEQPAALDLPAGVPDGVTFTDLLETGANFAATRGRLQLTVPPLWGRVLVQ